MKRPLLGLATWACTMALTTAPAEADFTVFPSILEVKSAPGLAALGTIKTRLEGEGGHRFRVRVKDLRQQPDGTPVYLPPSSSPFSASSWISVTPSSFPGGPDRVQPVQYRIGVPTNAQPGDHLAALVFERLPRGLADATAAPVEAVAARLTIEVRGRIRPRAKIVAVEAPGIADGGPVDLEALIRNTGNVTIDLDRGDGGAIEVLDGDDVKETMPLAGQIFPGSTRAFRASWDDPPLFGSFDARAEIETRGRHFDESSGFLVIPWRKIVALVLAVTAIALLYRAWRRRRWGY